jgi:hypothetical protein
MYIAVVITVVSGIEYFQNFQISTDN